MERFRQRYALGAAVALLLAPGCPKTDQPVEAAAAVEAPMSAEEATVRAKFAEKNPGGVIDGVHVYDSGDEFDNGIMRINFGEDLALRAGDQEGEVSHVACVVTAEGVCTMAFDTNWELLATDCGN